MNAPILLFVYNRLDHTTKTIESLKKNRIAKESILYIFSDGPFVDSEKQNVNAVRDYLLNIKGFKDIVIFNSKENKGLARSIIEGVSKIIEEHKRVIVLEDDLITSENFLTYMNSALNYYQSYSNIFQISGYTPQIPFLSKLKRDVYLSKRICSWGWAIWEDRWKSIDWEMSDFDDFIKDKKKLRLFSSAGQDKVSVLIGVKNGINDVWAIICDYGRFVRKDSLVIYPKESKVENIGSDGSGTHKDTRTKFDVVLDNSSKVEFDFDFDIVENKEVLEQFENFYSINKFNKFITYYSYRFGVYNFLKKIKKAICNG